MPTSRRRVRTIIAVSTLALACRSSSSSASFTAAEESTVLGVPPLPPLYYPQALFDSLGTVQAPAGHGSPSVRGMISVVFDARADQTARAAAIEAIKGRVVGGFRTSDNGDGEYFVRIDGTTYDDIERAIEAMRPQAGVALAYPLVVDTTHVVPR
jgi:hypothetical protein